MNDNKRATNVNQQIDILKSRGMIIDDCQKAKEYLSDIGYYRLGYYWFPFEKTYPKSTGRNHELKQDTRIEYAIKLYYFDFDIRNLFLRYISRIEINFRTKVIYSGSEHFSDNPFWYVTEGNFKKRFVSSTKYQTVLKEIKKEEAIAADLKKYSRNYSPAWKAIEHMTFGTVISIYDNLNDDKLKNNIALQFGIDSATAFSNQINAIRILRNHCAHGKVLFDMKFPQAIKNSNKVKLKDKKNKLSGGYIVLKYMLGVVSTNRQKELSDAMRNVLSSIDSQPVLDVIKQCSGLEESIL